MKTILGKIAEHKQAYANLPLFLYMRDASLTEEVRLAFYPCMAHFILSFGDINKYMLREEPTTDRQQFQIQILTMREEKQENRRTSNTEAQWSQ